MKVLLTLVALCLYCCQTQGQGDVKTCLPQPSVVVPIQGIIKNTVGLNLCNGTSGRVTTAFSEFLTEQIETNFNSPSKSCKLSNVQEVSCDIHGRNNRRISFKFSATLTCGDGCDDKYESDTQALQLIHSKRNDLRSAFKIKSIAEVLYLGRTVVMHYFQGKKGAISVTCGTSTVRSTKDKYPLCECPESCRQEGSETSDVCSLPPESGLCRGFFPRIFYNSTSKQCERFVYGGCGGNENNFESEEDCQTRCKGKKQQCPEGKVFQECGTACPKTCDNKNKPTFCTLQCVQGCFCPSGTVELGDKCVAEDQCPTELPATEEQQCPEGKVFQECGTACPKTCDNKDKPGFCTLQCVQGCFCPSGTVELGDKCVTADQCPTESPATEEQQCPEGKVFQECGTACPKTCENKDRPVPCTLQCVQGCFCPTGKVESGDQCFDAEECE